MAPTLLLVYRWDVRPSLFVLHFNAVLILIIAVVIDYASEIKVKFINDNVNDDTQQVANTVPNTVVFTPINLSNLEIIKINPIIWIVHLVPEMIPLGAENYTATSCVTRGSNACQKMRLALLIRKWLPMTRFQSAKTELQPEY